MPKYVFFITLYNKQTIESVLAVEIACWKV